MTNQLKRGDKLTVVDVQALACTTIGEITVDTIADDGRIVFVKGKRRFYLTINESILVLRGHGLGVKEGKWNSGNSFFIDANCNLGGLDRESMKTLLTTNINDTFNRWSMIYWFDGVSEKGEQLFPSQPEPYSEIEYVDEAPVIDETIEVTTEVEVVETVEEVTVVEEPTISEPQIAEVVDDKALSPIDDFSYLTVLSSKYDKKTAATNLRKVLKRAFPETQFSVKHAHAYCYYVRWTDGPTVEMVNKYAKLFDGGRFDAMIDYSYNVHTDFTNKYGWLDTVLTIRTVSEKHRMEEMEAYNKEHGTSYTMQDHVPEENSCMIDIVYFRTKTKDYTIRVPVKTTTKQKPKSSEKSIEPISCEGLEIKDYSEKSFAIIGNTKPIKDTLKSLGGRFNSCLSCGAGWIFSKTKIEEVKQALSIQ